MCFIELQQGRNGTTLLLYVYCCKMTQNESICKENIQDQMSR